MKEPTSEVSRDLYDRLVKAAKEDGNAGKRWRAKKIIDEFECGYTCEDVFMACARKHLKITPPGQAEFLAWARKEDAEERARLFAERVAAKAALAMNEAPEMAPEGEAKVRRKRRKRLPDGTLPPLPEPAVPPMKKRHMMRKKKPKEETT